ncbi:MAG: hypothetical protein HN535_03225 [Flavobacteriales bacterium]|jgi:hypothetical protein|nr:hypothetical protein [Flavobacteriales bacterium]MDG1349418.1 hypothetical protein [Flavobacteriales bacterium]|tara:strand:- start:1695 stop:2201 length:507 start_codon:yes stop_codon:yes gene_type:complete
MKNIVFLSALLFGFASCTNVTFVSPQPEFLSPLSGIPEKYQGEFVFASNDTDQGVNIITETTVNGISIFSDSVVVKTRGNYFYINLLDDKGNYELYVFKQIAYLNYEKIYAVFPNVKKEKLHLFNIIEDWSCNNGKQCYLLDEVNVNQFNLLVNSSFDDEKIELKRLN